MEREAAERPRISKLTGPNYRNWAKQIRLVLQDRKVWSAIDPEYTLDDDVEPPTKGEAESKDYIAARKAQIAKRRDVRASTIIMESCIQSVVDKIIRFDTAKEQWDQLRKMYARDGLQQLNAKNEAFSNYSPSSTTSLDDIVTTLDDLQDEINRINPDERPSDLKKAGRLTAIMTRRGGKYDIAAAQIMAAKVTEYEDIIQHFANIEEQIARSKPVVESARQASTGNDNTRGNGGRGRGRGGKASPENTRTCYHCGKTGHIQRNCDSKKRGEPNSAGPSTGPLAVPGGGKGLSPSPEEANVARIEVASATETSWIAAVGDREGVNGDWIGEVQDKSVAWIMDSGCSRHMTFDKQAFVSYVALDEPIPVRLANGMEIHAVAQGTVSFDIAVKGGKRRIQLHGEDAVTALRAVAMSPKEAMLWHRRFGHLSSKSLSLAHTVVDGLPGPIGELADPCDECLLNKSTRVINRKASEHAKAPLDRIHSDIWGPYRVPDIHGKSIYFVTFTDDYTRKTWVYVMRSRGQLRAIFTGFKIRVEQETGRKIKIVRCDNGGEYEALERDLGASEGILFEYTTPYTSYQNGVSERLNRALVALIRAMLSYARLPRKLWSEALMAACYLRNRLPIGPGNMSPEEAYSGKKPSVAHIRVWGCVAYANLSMEQRGGDKLAPNAIRTALVGYMPTSKQYRLYDPVGDQIIIATSVRFVEDQILDLPDDSDEGSPEDVGFDPMEAYIPQEPAIEAEGLRDRQGSVPMMGLRRGSDDIRGGDSRGESRDLLVDRSGSPRADRPAPAFGSPNRMVTPHESLPGWRSQASEDDSQDDGDRNRTGIGVRSGEASPRSEASPPPVQSIEQDDDQRPDPRNDQLFLEEEDDLGSPEDQILAESEAALQEASPVEEFNVRRSGRERRPTRPFEEAFEATYAVPPKLPNPGRYSEAVTDPEHGADWSLAVKEELTQLQSLGTWERAKLPRGKRVLGCRWVFNVKYTPTGLIDRFKARLVAQGFGQVPGDDYLETFSPTIRAESLRLLLSIGASEDMDIRQIDVVSAYPRSDLHAEVYMKPPEGLYCPEGYVLRLRKSLYGLKQSGREWYIEACKGLGELGFQPIFSEPSIFTTPDRRILIGLYVDDMLILSKDPLDIDRVVKGIEKRWKIKDLGEVIMILGIRVTRDRKNRRIFLDQEGYVDEIVKRFRLEQATPYSTPATTDRAALVKGDAMSGHIFMLNMGPVSWTSAKQRCVATSTTEAEYIALCEASKQAAAAPSVHALHPGIPSGIGPVGAPNPHPPPQAEGDSDLREGLPSSRQGRSPPRRKPFAAGGAAASASRGRSRATATSQRQQESSGSNTATTTGKAFGGNTERSKKPVQHRVFNSVH
ncbi:hypothetical protein V500_10440 [Pseudogymnoascus sp. VKM F-4518 (FW-2643)]|nr:hypothetical protein V500_10440 [Pseudogymnoascus sp. VKM F-4518 (FW-2643)]